nr:immunoglobulin light chain junction region [Macaca mulatta]MPN81938.1 immunoglobulin light chain junction region [Macaca mulatta]MPN82260.1 immunoglobulin light chain junction region [Macaca mulatta]MPN82308.1 immunoglobulin light chain junction region [Macaca mulatta]MPN82852.1 immunoglobulin light chain junction region [Macaca mulatta]
CQQYNSNPLTV